MVIDLFRPRPPGGPWLVLQDGAAPRFWQPDGASLSIIEQRLDGDDVGRFEAELQGDAVTIGRRLDVRP